MAIAGVRSNSPKDVRLTPKPVKRTVNVSGSRSSSIMFIIAQVSFTMINLPQLIYFDVRMWECE
jgi:hypothetical protein